MRPVSLLPRSLKIWIMFSNNQWIHKVVGRMKWISELKWTNLPQKKVNLINFESRNLNLYRQGLNFITGLCSCKATQGLSWKLHTDTTSHNSRCVLVFSRLFIFKTFERLTYFFKRQHNREIRWRNLPLLAHVHIAATARSTRRKQGPPHASWGSWPKNSAHLPMLPSLVFRELAGGSSMQDSNGHCWDLIVASTSLKCCAPYGVVSLPN